MKNLLIITEQKQIKESLKAILDDKFLLFSALTSEEALRIIKEKRIDIAIVDTPLKNMHIFEFIKAMRRLSPEVVPIILLSTSDENVREELIENKVYEWTIKPFKRKELANLLLRAEEKLQLMRRVKVLEDEKKELNLAAKEPVIENSPAQKNLCAGLAEEEFKKLFYSYQETFRKFSRILTHIFAPEELFEMIVHTLGEVFEVGKLAILIKDRNNFSYTIKSSLRIKKDVVGEFRIKEGDGIAGWLSKNGQILTRQNKNLPSSIKEEMELLESEICIPLFSDEDLLGFLSLGKKITGEDFVPGELRFLYMMSNYTALTIQNSYLYREIIQHREHLSDIMRNISSGVLAIDKRGKITSINKSAKDILGIKEEIIGEDIQKAGSIIADIMLRTLHDEKIYNRHEVVYPAGKNISLGISTVPLRDEFNRIKGALMIFQNISDVKRIEEELNKAKEEEFWKELTSRIAHGIRNPLVSISTFAQLLPEKKEEEDFVENYHETVLDSVNKLNYVVTRLEKLSDASKLTLSMENINLVLEGVLEEFQEEFKEQNIYVKKNIASYVPTSLIDGDKLKEVFANLIKNSLSAMREGGKLDIETSYDPRKKEIYLTFKDNGKGIEYEDMSKLYSPFFTTETKGLGLGLPIVKQIIEKHGGKSNISSIPRKGTTVEIFLPLMAEKEEVSSHALYRGDLPTSQQVGVGMDRQIPEPESVAARPVEEIVPPSLKKEPLSLEEEVAKIEKKLIIEALKKSEGVKVKAAKLLNISRRILAYKIEKLEIK